MNFPKPESEITITSADGLTLGIDEYLGTEREKDLSRQAQSIHGEEMEYAERIVASKNQRRISYVLRHHMEPIRGVARRVVRLPEEQIRKEYSLMAKPFAEGAKNVIWCIAKSGPIACDEIAKEIETTKAYVWQMVRTIFHKIPEFFIREGVRGLYLYKLSPAGSLLSVDQIYGRYTGRRGAGVKSGSAAKSGAEKGLPEAASELGQEILVDFCEVADLHALLTADAKKEFRTPEAQILYILSSRYADRQPLTRETPREAAEPGIGEREEAAA